jgi:hypothetical protein
MPLVLPPEPHMPGLTARPDDALFAPLKSGLGSHLDVEALAASAAFLGGREAFERGYFWEAHELWEAVWTCLPPASAERNLLRGLIQLANARLKLRMARPRAVERIAALADSALQEAFRGRTELLMGLSRVEVEALGERLREDLAEPGA